MKAGTCPRTFEVEAARDGRLAGAARKHFQRHVESCTVCAAEAAALDGLAHRAKTALDDAHSDDDLRFWRERTRLLAAFDGALLSANRPARARRAARLLLWPLAAAAVVAAIAALKPPRPGAEGRPAPLATIRADAGAAWDRRPDGRGREEIALRRGTLWIHVDRAVGERPVHILLPDGELEDLGTTFTVSTDGAATTRVTVEEGRIVLRLRGRPSVDLGAGDVWPPRAPAVAPLPAAAPPPAAPPPHGKHPAATARAARLMEPLPPRRRPSPAAADDPLVAFRAAAAALRAGDDAGAAMAFTRFLDEHPGDPMAEDAAYLRVIAFQRMGAAADMKRAARAYLRQFPSGFRRDEISHLLD